MDSSFTWSGPAHEFVPKDDELRLGKRFGKDVSPIFFRVHFVDLEPALDNLITEVMPFYGEMFRTGTILLSIVGESKSGGVVFQDNGRAKAGHAAGFVGTEGGIE
jgi:hypothetical protein